jgi:hypothetical protein
MCCSFVQLSVRIVIVIKHLHQVRVCQHLSCASVVWLCPCAHACVFSGNLFVCVLAQALAATQA